MGTCKHCKYWGRQWETDSGRQECTWSDDWNKSKISFEVYAYASDDTGLTSRLLTSPDFGCVLFKLRTENSS